MQLENLKTKFLGRNSIFYNKIDSTQNEINLNIKEPNDITFNNKKIGGILTQTKLVNEKVKYLVVGIEINTKKEKFTDDIKNIATSIKKEFGIDVDTNW